MNVARSFRKVAALMRVGLQEAVAYRAEMFVWMLTTTMPLIMLPLWHTVAEEAPVGGFTAARFTGYFVAAFVVRQLTSAWACWSMNWEIRSGVMSMKLLRPVHPLWTYAVENLSAMPMRVLISVPAALVLLLVTGDRELATSLTSWLLFVPAVAGAWAITFLAHAAVGTLALWIQSSLKLMDAWTVGFFVMSGYLVPVQLFPPWLRVAADVLPFRYQLGFPVDVMTGALDTRAALLALGTQWAWIAALFGLVLALWNRGIARYGAYGG